ncbi:MAG TPA: MMPL family transporter, partial [Bdellovibrionota bacterium]|nr:MMPL family transporter [Bdellovibrionota bacterium]
MNAFSRLIIHRAKAVLAVGLVLTLVGAYYTVQLYANLRTSFEEMLPTTARSVVDLHHVTARLPATDNLAVLIFSQDAEAAKRFQDDLAEAAQKLPKDLVALVEWRIDREMAFFNRRQPLYMDLGDLGAVHDYIRDRIDYERTMRNPLTIFNGIELREPQLDFSGMEKKYRATTDFFSRFPGGYYATFDGRIRAVLVYKTGSLTDASQARRLRAELDRIIVDLKPARYAKDLEIKFTGDIQNMIEEEAALVADLKLATLVVLLLTGAALYWYFRSFRGVAALLGSLLMGTLWTFGVARGLVGYLNANSAFLGAIVIGNGINYGIIFLARYLEERQAGEPHTRATQAAMAGTMTATWTAALAAGLSYGSLMLTSFRGFSQFGIIGLEGMVLCWISSYALMPAILTLFERRGTLWAPDRKPPKRRLTSALARSVSRRPILFWNISVVIAAAALASFVRIPEGNLMQNDLSKLRDKRSMAEGSGYNNRYIEEIFGREISPVAVMMQTRAQASEVARRLKKRKEKEGPGSLMGAVRSIDDFLPSEQWRKIQSLKRIKGMLYPVLIQRLNDTERRRVEELLTPEAFAGVTAPSLPPLVLSKFTEKDGSLGKMVLVEPQLNSESWSGAQLNAFIDGIREVADAVGSGALVAGQLPVTSDMFKAVRRDGPRATLFAFLAVIVLVLILFRDARVSAMALFALVLGVVWFAGAILGFGLKINFLNFISLPITFGIGVDY